MINEAIQNLGQLKSLIEALPDEAYSRPCDHLSNGSIGQHVRHILEFFECLERGYACGLVNYDSRKRNLEIETKKSVAISTIDQIHNFLSEIDLSKTVILTGNWGMNEGKDVEVQSNYLREVVYNMEHSIHHQALVRVGLISQGLNHLVDPHFGIAPATLRNKVK